MKPTNVAPDLIRGLIAAPKVPGQARDSLFPIPNVAPDLIRGLPEARP